jgi:hypothetical protein
MGLAGLGVQGVIVGEGEGDVEEGELFGGEANGKGEEKGE